MVVAPEVIQVFQNPQIGMKLRQELHHKFARLGMRNFQLIEYSRFEFLKDSMPLAFVIMLPFHPQHDLRSHLPKEEIFQSLEGTILANQPICILGEVISA